MLKVILFRISAFIVFLLHISNIQMQKGGPNASVELSSTHLVMETIVSHFSPFLIRAFGLGQQSRTCAEMTNLSYTLVL